MPSTMPTLADPTIFDGFNAGDPAQSNRLRATFAINLGGLDITAKINPYLISLRLLCGAKIEDYQCEIELDDSNGQLPIPPINAPLTVALGWVGEYSAVIFEGVVHDIEHGFSRKEGGRRMWVHGTGQEYLGNGKMPNSNSWGEGAPPGTETGTQIPLSTPLQGAAAAAGHTINIHPAFNAVTEDHWEQTNESYYHYARRLAEKYGGLFRVISGTNGQFTIQGQNIDGTQTPMLAAVAGKNLIGSRVRPFAARPMWSTAKQHFFDIQMGQWKLTQKNLTAAGLSAFATAAYSAINPAPNLSSAGMDVEGVDDGTQQVQGPGRIVINGEPYAQGNAWISLSGVRPGVDGVYWCQTAEHNYSRALGYITWLEVQAAAIPAGSFALYGKGSSPIDPLQGIPLPTPAPGVPLPKPPLLGG